jgi:DNA-binding CsgD family transcriptional regulator
MSSQRRPLPPREADITRLLLHGASSTELCEALSIGSETLRSHMKRFFARTGSWTRVELLPS